MSYRFMRMIVFFDLPTETNEDKRNYRKFRKMLVNNGFMMLQESVYCRLLLNGSVAKAKIDTIRNNKPAKGLVQVLTVTEKQFAGIEFIVGEHKSDIIDSDERLIVP